MHEHTLTLFSPSGSSGYATFDCFYHATVKLIKLHMFCYNRNNNPFVDLSYRTKQKKRGTNLDKSLLNVAHDARANGGGLRNATLNHKLNTNMISETATIETPSAVIKTTTMVHNNSTEHGDANSTLPQTGSMHGSELAMLGLIAIGMGVATVIGAGSRKKED